MDKQPPPFQPEDVRLIVLCGTPSQVSCLLSALCQRNACEAHCIVTNLCQQVMLGNMEVLSVMQRPMVGKRGSTDGDDFHSELGHKRAALGMDTAPPF